MLHLSELLDRGVPWKSPNNPSCFQDYIGCSPQNDGKTPLLKTIPIQLTEHGEVQLVPTHREPSSGLHSSVFSTERYSANY